MTAAQTPRVTSSGPEVDVLDLQATRQSRPTPTCHPRMVEPCNTKGERARARPRGTMERAPQHRFGAPRHETPAVLLEKCGISAGSCRRPARPPSRASWHVL